MIWISTTKLTKALNLHYLALLLDAFDGIVTCRGQFAELFVTEIRDNWPERKGIQGLKESEFLRSWLWQWYPFCRCGLCRCQSCHIFWQTGSFPASDQGSSTHCWREPWVMLSAYAGFQASSLPVLDLKSWLFWGFPESWTLCYN